MGKTARQIVVEFCDAFARKDLDLIINTMAPDCVYENVPAPAMHGREAARAFLSDILRGADKVEFVMRSIATADDGATILTERVDTFQYGSDQVALPLMGIFVVRDGLIAEWRDYADIASYTRQMAAIGSARQPGVAAT